MEYINPIKTKINALFRSVSHRRLHAVGIIIAISPANEKTVGNTFINQYSNVKETATWHSIPILGIRVCPPNTKHWWWKTATTLKTELEKLLKSGGSALPPYISITTFDFTIQSPLSFDWDDELVVSLLLAMDTDDDHKSC